MTELQNTVLKMLSTADVAEVPTTQLEEALPNVAHGDVVAALKSLESAGHGRFIVGRKGKPSRFNRTVTTKRQLRKPKISSNVAQRAAAKVARDSKSESALPTDASELPDVGNIVAEFAQAHDLNS